MNTHVLEVLGLKRPAGVHPPSSKLGAQTAIERAPLPETVTLPLQQHIGAPAKVLVKTGDEVKVGQVIAEAGGFVSAPIHATISGKVKQLPTVASSVTGKAVPGVVIESDGQDEWIELSPADPDKLSPSEIVSRIKGAGIVGMGGATFPSHVKLSPPPEKTINTVIVNGAECEPYITADNRLMIEHPERVLSGLAIVMKALSVKRAFVAIEDNKPQAIAKMREQVSQMKFPGDVNVHVVPRRYPMGAEKTLINTILGKQVPEGGLPMDVGALVHNVATLAAIHDAIVLGKPLVERVISVTGLVKTPKNFLARFGTPASALIDLCGGSDSNADELIFGGPMMGIAQPSFETAIIKGTNCILVKKSDLREEHDCIRCGRCVETCPMGLLPLQFVNLVKHEDYDHLINYHINNCVECGSCAYGCPANIPLVAYIKVGKLELRKLGVK
ncbi:MAG TPA: electron transport complex subunit RsxC [Candidatus Acetothermia bacterium]|nr:electron transport complex subunit RsxC [Candidatus Acetothermia bacterium]